MKVFSWSRWTSSEILHENELFYRWSCSHNIFLIEWWFDFDSIALIECDAVSDELLTYLRNFVSMPNRFSALSRILNRIQILKRQTQLFLSCLFLFHLHHVCYCLFWFDFKLRSLKPWFQVLPPIVAWLLISPAARNFRSNMIKLDQTWFVTKQKHQISKSEIQNSFFQVCITYSDSRFIESMYWSLICNCG